jgi:DnaK suppressor protein
MVPVSHDQFVALQINRLDVNQLKLIDDALTSADYGVCVDCGEPIPRRRLDAIPWAARCIACEERLNSIGDPAQPAELDAWRRA